MGARRPDAYFSLSMMCDRWHSLANPDLAKPFTTLNVEFGEIRSRGAVLHADKTYSTVTPPQKGINLFQGDIVELDLSHTGSPRHKYSIILSHSCDLQKLSHILVAPAFLEPELTPQTISFLRNGKATNSLIQKQFIQMWSENEHIPFIGLPPSTQLSEPLTIALPLMTYQSQPTLIVKQPVLRLTFRALIYLQGRLATSLLRDVQDSDETRQL
jgi:hypothetical protein